jgi:uncharacterized repeat protein (TIGR03803 family)
MKCTKSFAQGFSHAIGAMIALVIVAAGPSLSAQTPRVIHEFNDTKGGNPVAQLVFDSSGNLYGTAQTGGRAKCTSDCGVVFKLYKSASGGWIEDVLHSFRGGKTDAGSPLAGVVFDGAGNMYGTTYGGGSSLCGGYGCGAVYELSPTITGGWTYSVIYAFSGGADGAQPLSQLVLDGSGNLYGTTLYGGANDFGGVFELSHASGAWTEAVLYSFTGGSDGAEPYAGVVFDGSGNLYGTTWKGGLTGGICASQGCGVVFELSKSSGAWTESVLHTFSGGADGAYSQASLTIDTHGNLYGVTGTGGVSGGCGGEGCGLVFELSNSGGTWTETVLLTFQPGTSGFGGPGGANPYSGVTLDALGNLYGATHNGGVHGDGVVFELSPPTTAGWTETVLHSFNVINGELPQSGVTLDGSGNLYGAAPYGGTGGYCGGSCGTIYEITP